MEDQRCDSKGIVVVHNGLRRQLEHLYPLHKNKGNFFLKLSEEPKCFSNLASTQPTKSSCFHPFQQAFAWKTSACVLEIFVGFYLQKNKTWRSFRHILLWIDSGWHSFKGQLSMFRGSKSSWMWLIAQCTSQIHEKSQKWLPRMKQMSCTMELKEHQKRTLEDSRAVLCVQTFSLLRRFQSEKHSIPSSS